MSPPAGDPEGSHASAVANFSRILKCCSPKIPRPPGCSGGSGCLLRQLLSGPVPRAPVALYDGWWDIASVSVWQAMAASWPISLRWKRAAAERQPPPSYAFRFETWAGRRRVRSHSRDDLSASSLPYRRKPRAGWSHTQPSGGFLDLHPRLPVR